MVHRIFNFSAGPSTMPLAVLERAQREMLSIDGTGMSVMEMSHRSSEFEAILAKAEQGLRGLLAVPDNFRILFLPGGGSMQFAMVPLNFLGHGETADYVITGHWGEKAAKEAAIRGGVNVVYTSAGGGYRTTPDPAELNFSPAARYIHYVSNETIEGVEFKYDVDGGGIPVVCDMSSNILSRPLDLTNYDLIYCGAQKNIGPSGLAVAFIRDELLDRASHKNHTLLDYRTFAENGSMPNTPNTWAIYMTGLVCDWLTDQGGVTGIHQRNAEKAAAIYGAIDASDGFYNGHAERAARSLMNVTFRLPSQDLDETFCREADDNGMSGLRGHRSVGGIRASIYNAFPREGVAALVDLMNDFAARRG